MPGTLLVTDRLLVRRPAAADQDAYLGLLRDSAAFHRPWFPAPPEGSDPFGPEAFATYLAGDDGERRVRFLLFERGQGEDRAEGPLVGAVNVGEIVRGVFRSAYLGYFLGAHATGRGYMREGLDAVVTHAFADRAEGGLGLHRLEANIIPDNAPSLAVVRALGFRREGLSERYLKIDGRWRDHERWAITVEDRTGR